MKIRLKYYVYPQFQTALLLANVIINLSLFTFLSVKVQLFFELLIQNGKSAGFNEGHIYYEFINSQRSHLKLEFLIALTLSLILTSIFTLWLSHKLAGPLVRLKNVLISTAESGIYKSIKFREKDYFKDIPECLDRAIESIQKHDDK
jgi:hypothetical protein